MKKKQFFVAMLTASLMMIYSCGSFQGISYYSADGIYNPEGDYSSPTTEVVVRDNNTQYYKNYFRDAGREFTDLSGQSTETFTDVENYVTDNQNPHLTQNMWGDRPAKTNIYINNNNFNPYAFNRFGFYGGWDPWMWNDMYYGPGINNPRFGFRNRFNYWNRGFYGGFYDPFFSPWDPINRWGWGWGSQRFRYWDRFSRYNRYYPYNNLPYDRRDRDRSRSYSRVNSNRGAQSQTNRRSQSALTSLGGGNVEVPQLSRTSNASSRLQSFYGRIRPSNSSPAEGVVKSRQAASQVRSPKQVGRGRSYGSPSRAQQTYMNRKIKVDKGRANNSRPSTNSNRTTTRRSYNNSNNASSSRNNSSYNRSTRSNYSSGSRGSYSSPSRGSSTAGRSRGGGR
ncbi:MAG: hypothetical protein ACON42_05660 [Flavobacteriaceae bacterium]